MQARTRAAITRPLPVAPASGAPAARPASTSASALPTPVQPLRRRQTSIHQSQNSRPPSGVTPLTQDVFASALPAAPGTNTTSSTTHALGTAAASRSPHSHPQPTSPTTTHMPALPSAATTPTARQTPLTSPSQRHNVATHRGATLSPTRAERPARLRSLSDANNETDEHTGGDNIASVTSAGSASDGVSESGVAQRARRHSSGSTSRLPAMLQPSKLASAPTATLPSSVLTSPARMASQPDVHALAVSSPARRNVLTGGSLHEEAEGSSSCTTGSEDASDKKTFTTTTGSPTMTTPGNTANTTATTSAFTTTRSPPSQAGKLVGPPDSRESLPIPPPPPASATATRRTRNDSGRRHTFSPDVEPSRGEAYLRENPRVRTLVNNLYQQVVTAQPEDPLHYLANFSTAHTVVGSNSGGTETVSGTLAGRHSSTYPPHEHARDATTTTITTSTDTRRVSDGSEPNACHSPAPACEVPPPTPQRQQQQPPLSRAGRLVTPRAMHLSTANTVATASTAAAAGGGGGGVILPVRGHSSPVQSNQSRRPSLDSGLSLVSGGTTTVQPAASIPGAVATAVPTPHAMTVPTPAMMINTHGNANSRGSVAGGSATHHSARASATGGSSSSAVTNSRTARAPPPSAPTTSLVTRLASAGSPAMAASLRSSTLGSGKLGSPFPTSRANTQIGSCGGFSSSTSRVMAHQTSFVGSLTGGERGDVTPSDASSLFSTNSVDLQDFLTEFRMAKEECCGGGIEAPRMSLDDLAMILESVAFPFSDATALMDLFDELQPCAHYLTEAASGVAGNAQGLSQRDSAAGAGRRGAEPSAAADTLQLTSCSGGVTAEEEGEGVAYAALDTHKANTSTGIAATSLIAANTGADEASAVVAAAVPGRLSAAAAGSRGAAAGAHASTCTAIIPLPPPAKPTGNGGVADEHAAGTPHAFNHERAAAAATVPFDTFVARMAYKIQGRYTAEAIRIAFYGMVLDEEAAAAGDAAGTAAAAAAATFSGHSAECVGTRRLSNVFSTDSLAPSEPAGTFSTMTTMNEAGMPACTVPLLRCLSEGLYGRLGMVDVTASDVQRGVRSAGLPTSPEDQRVCECHLADFARLVRAVTTVADRGFSISPGNFCLTSQRGSPSATSSWREEPAGAGASAGGSAGRTGVVPPPVHTIRYL